MWVVAEVGRTTLVEAAALPTSTSAQPIRLSQAVAVGLASAPAETARVATVVAAVPAQEVMEVVPIPQAAMAERVVSEVLAAPLEVVWLEPTAAMVTEVPGEPAATTPRRPASARALAPVEMEAMRLLVAVAVGATAVAAAPAVDRSAMAVAAAAGALGPLVLLTQRLPTPVQLERTVSGEMGPF